MNGDYYQILGVNQDATLEEIKRAYHEKARQFHPDLNPDPVDSEEFLAIQEAFETLKNSEQRRQYDQTISKGIYLQPVTRIRYLTSRKAIPRLGEDQLMYLLMEIECLKTDEEMHSPRAHVCLVIDCSTSMNGKRLDMVKENITRVLDQLNERDLLSIVTFSDEAEVFLPPTQLNNLEVIKARISQISTSGSTEIKKGLKAGIDLLWQGQRENFSRNLILLTDGHTYGDEEDCYRLAAKAADQGIMINAMGIGHEWHEAFLEKMTSLTGGTTLFINSKDFLSHYLKSFFSSLNTIYAQNLRLSLQLDSRLSLQYLFQLDPNVVQHSLEGTHIMLGDLYYGKKSVFLMEFTVHPLIKKDKDVELLTGQIIMDLPHEEQKKARLFPHLSLKVVDELVGDRPPEEIVRALSKVTLYTMQERSREDVKIGSIIRATRRLNYLASRLLAEGEVQLAQRVLSENETIKETQHFSQDGEKELKYGTKQLLALPNPK
jgi:Ca-activated chloride channel family protein